MAEIADKPLAQTNIPAVCDDAAYAAIYAALMQTARGRAFLAEHARRSRRADTERVLAAIARLEAAARAGRAPLESAALACKSAPLSAAMPDGIGSGREQMQPTVGGGIDADGRQTAAARDPLAALRALSAEETIALFS